MPCEDCAGVRVELLALKEYMAQWFGLILKQVNAVENKASEFRSTVSKHLDKQDESLQTLLARSHPSPTDDSSSGTSRRLEKISTNEVIEPRIWSSDAQKAMCSSTAFPSLPVVPPSAALVSGGRTEKEISVFDSLKNSGCVKLEDEHEEDNNIQKNTPGGEDPLVSLEQCFGRPNIYAPGSSTASAATASCTASHSFNAFPAITVESVVGEVGEGSDIHEQEDDVDMDGTLLHTASPGCSKVDGLSIRQRRRCIARRKPKVSGHLTVISKRSSGQSLSIQPGSNVDYYECRICHVKIRCPEYLPKHAGIHLGIKPFQCNYCHYKTLRKDNIRVHMKVKHKAPDTEQPQILMDELDYKALLRKKVRDCFEFESV